jgi:solute carrier family 25 (mitochondrial carnitine/acylcarnitine transporter), member 20/29
MSAAAEIVSASAYAQSQLNSPPKVPPWSVDLIAGTFGGLVSVGFGQPFDLVRVRLQAANSSDVLATAQRIWTQESPRAFYKGATMPFIGSGVSVAVQFTVFHRTREWFESHSKTTPITFGQIYLSGFVAGVANSVITGPVEHIRTRMQMQPHGSARLYASSWDCMKQVFAQAGFRGLYKSYPVAVAKEAQAFGCYFAAFEASLHSVCRLVGKQRSDVGALELIPCGAMGGIGFWVGSYPIDVVKNMLQNDGFGKEARYRNAWSAVAETWRSGGMMGFWRGLAPTLLRTSLSSAGCFTV